MIHRLARKSFRIISAPGRLLMTALFLLAALVAQALAVPPPTFSAGNGTPGNPYQIITPADLRTMGAYLASGLCFELKNDIDLAATIGSPDGTSNLGWLPIALDTLNPFQGYFDGQGHTISGLAINNPIRGVLGLFGAIGSEGFIVGLKVNTGSDSVAAAGQGMIGIIAGYSAGQLHNCSVFGTVSAGTEMGRLVGRNAGTVKNCVADGYLRSAGENLGGLVGSNLPSGTVTNSHSYGIIEGSSTVGGLVGSNSGSIFQSFAVCTIMADSICGGLVGVNSGSGSMSSCYARGDLHPNGSDRALCGGLVGLVMSGSLYSSYASASISGGSGSNVGGLIGQVDGALIISDSYWDTLSSGLSTSAAGTARSTEIMKTAAAYNGWDFSSVWELNPGENDGYPSLRTRPDVQMIGMAIPAAGTYTLGDTLRFRAWFSEPLTVPASMALNLQFPGGTWRFARCDSGSGTRSIRFSYAVQAWDVAATGMNITDYSVNRFEVILDTAGTVVESIVLRGIPALGGIIVNGGAVPAIDTASDYGSPPVWVAAGRDIIVSLPLRGEVFAHSGSPYVNIVVGDTTRAVPLGFESAEYLTATFTVAPGELDTDGVTVLPEVFMNGGSITDAFGRSLSTAFLCGTSPIHCPNTRVDAVDPLVDSVLPPATGTYTTGQALDFTVRFDEIIGFSVPGAPAVDMPPIGSRLLLNIGGTLVTARYLSGAGSSRIVYRAAVPAGAVDANGVSLDSLCSGDNVDMPLSDLAGNKFDTSLAAHAAFATVKVNGAAPGVLSLEAPADRYYRTGETLALYVDVSEKVTVVGRPTIDLTIGSTVRSLLCDAGLVDTARLRFSYTIVAGDEDLDGVALGSVIKLSAATIKNSGGTNLSLGLNGVPSLSAVRVGIVDSLTATIDSIALNIGSAFGVVVDTAGTIYLSSAAVERAAPEAAPLASSAALSARPAADLGGFIRRYHPTTGISDTLTRSLVSPRGLALDGNGLLYVTCSATGRLYSIDVSSGDTATVADFSTTGATPDIFGVALDGLGNAYVATFSTLYRVRLASGQIDTIAMGLGACMGVKVDANGQILISEAFSSGFSSINPANKVRTPIGGPRSCLGFCLDGQGNAYTVSLDGNLYREVLATAEVTVIAAFPGEPRNVAIDSSGDAWVVCGSGAFYKIAIDAQCDTVLAPANKTYIVGDTLRFGIKLSAAVRVAGSPSLALTIGSTSRTAIYDPLRSHDSTLSFFYVVVQGDKDADGLTLSPRIALNGAAVHSFLNTRIANLPSFAGVKVDGSLAQTITFARPAAKVYGAAAFSLVATASSGAAVTFTSLDTTIARIAATSLSIVGAGKVAIRASVAASASWKAAALVETLTVAKAALTITASDTAKKFGAADPAAFSSTCLGFVKSETIAALSTFTLKRDSGETVGDYAIRPLATARNYQITLVNGVFSISAVTAIIDRGIDTLVQGMTAGLLAGPNPVALSRGAVELWVNSVSAANIHLVICDPLGNVLDEQDGITESSGVPQRFTWDLCNSAGVSVGRGMYLAMARVTSKEDGSVRQFKVLVSVR